MRIAFFTHYAQARDGANLSLLALLEGLSLHGVQAMVVHPEPGDLASVLQPKGVTCLQIPFCRWASKHPSMRKSALRLYYNLRCVGPIAAQLKSWQPNVIYTNSLIIPIGLMVARYMRLPHLWHLREFGDLHAGLFPDWGKWIQRKVIGKSEAIIAVSRVLKDYLLCGESEDHAHVIYNGVIREADMDRFRPGTPPLTGDVPPYTFAMIGYLRQSKGQDLAVRALGHLVRRHPEVRLALYGAGEARYIEECRQMASVLGIGSKVVFGGYQQDPFHCLATADAALVCSRHEGMGRVTAEAMAAGRPVIGYAEAGTLELITHGHNGLLFKGGPEELAQHMEELVQRPDWARELGANGWRTARERFTVEKYSQSVHDVIRGLLDGRAERKPCRP